MCEMPLSHITYSIKGIALISLLCSSMTLNNELGYTKNSRAK